MTGLPNEGCRHEGRAYIDVAATVIPARLAPPLARSWHRCLLGGLDPASRPLPFCALNAEQAALGSRLAAHIEDLEPVSDYQQFAVLLVDVERTVILRSGDSNLLAELARSGILPGASLAESQVGTNAADLALHEAQPVRVSGSEHYCRIWHSLACAAVPIFEPFGSALGALLIVCPLELAHPHCQSLAIAAVQAIQDRLRNEQLLADANDQLAILIATLEAVSEGLIFVDTRQAIRHINSQAAGMLGMTVRSVSGQPLEKLGEIPAPIRLALTQRVELNDSEVHWQNRRTSLLAMCSVRPVWDRSRRYTGALITLRPAELVQQLVHEVVGARAQFSFYDIVGQSPALQEALHQAYRAASSTAGVLLAGEAGVGKDLFAQSIHNASNRAAGPYIKLNCAAIPRAMLAGELFGIEGDESRGERGRPGKLELAHGGTLFLEGIEVLSFDLQTSLLRTIEMQRLIRSGGRHALPVDVRIIATSGIDLARLIGEARFRPDLAARLVAFRIDIPPLRERGDDLLLLSNYLLLTLSERFGRQVALAPEALEAMRNYAWPGNVRELELALERLVQHSEKTILKCEDLPPPIARAAGGPSPLPQSTLYDSQMLSEYESIRHAGRRAGGKLGRTAELLGISRATLWRKMKRYDMQPADFWRD